MIKTIVFLWNIFCLKPGASVAPSPIGTNPTALHSTKYITPLLASKWVIGQMQNISKRDSLSEMQLQTQNEGKSESQESSDWLVANRREGGHAAHFDTLTTISRLLLVPFLPFLLAAFSFISFLCPQPFFDNSSNFLVFCYSYKCMVFFPFGTIRSTDFLLI